MKRRRRRQAVIAKRQTVSRRGAGRGTTSSTGKKPTPGWKGFDSIKFGWRNPRPPAVPATLDLTQPEYFGAAALIGLLAGQTVEPDKKWCRDWAFDLGTMMATEARRRRRRRK